MAADQRHRDAAVLGERDDRCAILFVAQDGRQGADQDRRRANSDNGGPLAVEPPKMRHRVVKNDVGIVGASGQPVNGAAFEFYLEPARQRQTIAAEDDENRLHRHAAPRLCDRISEK